MILETHLQQRMDAAFDNYLQLTRVLEADMTLLFKGESEDQHWRRNCIRAATALVEGHTNCLKAMCAVSSDCVAPKLAKKEEDFLRSQSHFSADDRVKLTLRTAYKLFELAPVSDFRGHEWKKAQAVLSKRDLLMHPKTPADIEIPDSSWSELRIGITWLIEQFFNFLSLLESKHS